MDILRAFSLLSVLALAAGPIWAQPDPARISGSLVETTSGPYAAGDPFEVLVQLTAVPGTVGLGTSTFVLDFDADVLAFSETPQEGQDYTFLNYDGEQAGHQGGTAYYSSLVRRTGTGRLTLVVLLRFATDDRGQALSSRATDVVRLRFTVRDPRRLSAFSFTNVQAFTGPGDPYDLGVFEGLGAVIPIELASFAAQQTETGVALTWETLSETNNAQFVVERAVAMTGASGGGVSTEPEAAAPFEVIGYEEGGGTRTERKQYTFTDSSLPFTARSASYRLKQVDFDGASTYTESVEVAVGVPAEFAVHPAFPNPVRGQATLRYELPSDGPVEIVVFDLLGRRVQVLLDEEQEAGRYETRLDTRMLASGVYIYRVLAGNGRATEKVTVVR